MSHPRAPSSPVPLHGIVTADAAAIRALRDAPPPEGAPALPSRFLRHADEHTVVGVRAVMEAMAARPSDADRFERFAVVAAPCGAGRPASARTLVQLRAGGAVTVSPHVVPQCSLHAVAAAVSVGLGMHGPNVGVGGGPEALGEGILAALSLLDEPDVDGCWLVLTAWDTEPALDDAGDAPSEALCRGVALALDRSATATLSLSLRRAPALAVVGADGPPDDGSRLLAEFASALGAAGRWRGPGAGRAGDCDGCLWTHRLRWGGRVTLAHDAAAMVVPLSARRAA